MITISWLFYASPEIRPAGLIGAASPLKAVINALFAVRINFTDYATKKLSLHKNNLSTKVSHFRI